MICYRTLVLLSILVFATGCADEITCPAWSFPAVQVNLESATTGSAIIGAFGEVHEGQYRDSLLDLGNGWYTAAENRGGIYTVHVESPGYAPWDTTGVDVEQVGGSCPTVETEILEVRLTPTQ